MARPRKKQGATLDARLAPLVTEKLASSGLDLSDYDALGMGTVTAEELQAIWPTFPKQPALALNYYDYQGQPWRDVPGAKPFARYRVLGAATEFGDQAKDRRYLQVKETLPGVYLPRSVDWVSVIANHDVPLLITEGELKAAKACKEGFVTIGLGGVWNFRSHKQGYDFLPQLEAFTWARRNVYVVFDSDLSTNRGVLQALEELAFELQQRGAYVHVVWLPEVLGAGEKVGLDDFLVARGAVGVDELHELLHHADALGLTRPLFALNERYVYVANPGLIMDLATDAKHKPTALKEHLAAPTTVTVKKLTADGQVRFERASAGAEWLKWPLRNEVGKLTYAPGRERFIREGRGMYNLWAGWGVEPKAGDVSPFLELVNHLFMGADKGAKDWFLRWCAYPLQYPGTKLFSSAVIWGRRHGTGKSLIFETLGKVYGENFTAIKQRHLQESHNEWAENKQFVLGDDVTGTDKREIADELKTLITQSKIRLNPKYVPSFTLPDVINYGFTSNQPDAFFMEDDDRRFFIWEVVAAPKDEDWYVDYKLWLDTGGAAAVFDYLLKLDLGAFNPAGRAYETQAKQAMIADARSDLGSWCHQLLTDPDSVLRVGSVTVRRELMSNKELLQFYDPHGRTRTTANGLGRELKRAGFVQVNKGLPVKTSHGQDRYYAVRRGEMWAEATHSQLVKHLEAEFKASLGGVNGHASAKF